MTPFPYRINVRWSPPDDAYVAEAPAFPGAGGDGATPEVAVRAAQAVVEEQLALKRKFGDPIPAPDVEEADFSGQLRLRMPRSLHRQLAAAAEREGVSLNQLIVTYLANQVARGAQAFSADHRLREVQHLLAKLAARTPTSIADAWGLFVDPLPQAENTGWARLRPGLLRKRFATARSTTGDVLYDAADVSPKRSSEAPDSSE